MNEKELAKMFHETYERLAPKFGYETRPETRKFSQDSNNGKLTIAVCREIINWMSGKEIIDNEQRLARIAEIIVRVGDRCLVADGPVGEELKEMRKEEFDEIYKLAKEREKF